jgi:branched-subunit amino acid aminotransferase/4-amino-4-deoxychorismate lyase
MDYNYHQVHLLDIPSLIKNLKENDEVRKKLTPEQRNAQKKWFEDILSGNYASARKAKEKAASAKEETERLLCHKMQVVKYTTQRHGSKGTSSYWKESE